MSPPVTPGVVRGGESPEALEQSLRTLAVEGTDQELTTLIHWLSVPEALEALDPLLDPTISCPPHESQWTFVGGVDVRRRCSTKYTRFRRVLASVARRTEPHVDQLLLWFLTHAFTPASEEVALANIRVLAGSLPMTTSRRTVLLEAAKAESIYTLAVVTTLLNDASDASFEALRDWLVASQGARLRTLVESTRSALGGNMSEIDTPRFMHQLLSEPRLPVLAKLKIVDTYLDYFYSSYYFPLPPDAPEPCWTFPPPGPRMRSIQGIVAYLDVVHQAQRLPVHDMYHKAFVRVDAAARGDLAKRVWPQ